MHRPADAARRRHRLPGEIKALYLNCRRTRVGSAADARQLERRRSAPTAEPPRRTTWRWTIEELPRRLRFTTDPDVRDSTAQASPRSSASPVSSRATASTTPRRWRSSCATWASRPGSSRASCPATATRGPGSRRSVQQAARLGRGLLPGLRLDHVRPDRRPVGPRPGRRRPVVRAAAERHPRAVHERRACSTRRPAATTIPTPDATRLPASRRRTAADRGAVRSCRRSCSLVVVGASRSSPGAAARAARSTPDGATVGRPARVAASGSGRGPTQTVYEYASRARARSCPTSGPSSRRWPGRRSRSAYGARDPRRRPAWPACATPSAGCGSALLRLAFRRGGSTARPRAEVGPARERRRCLERARPAASCRLRCDRRCVGLVGRRERRRWAVRLWARRTGRPARNSTTLIAAQVHRPHPEPLERQVEQGQQGDLEDAVVADEDRPRLGRGRVPGSRRPARVERARRARPSASRARTPRGAGRTRAWTAASDSPPGAHAPTGGGARRPATSA